MTTYVEIDPNVRVRDNWTFTREEWVLGPITVGANVRVVESEIGLIGNGRIEEYDEEQGLVYLSVDWESLRLGSPFNEENK